MNNKDYTLLASICRDDTSALNAILYNNSKATSAEVVQCMFHRSVNNKCGDIKILVMFDYAMAVDLKEAGFNNVYFTTDCPVIIRKTKEGLEAKTGIKVLTLKEIKNMKFDVGLGNPPFSEVGAGNKTGTGKKSLLYPQFFKLATEICKTGAMIMPPTAQVNRDNKKHNELIKLTAHNIVRVSEEEKNKMGVGIDMWTIYWGSEGDVNEHFIEEVVRNNVEWKIGTPRLLTDNISATKTRIHNTPAIKSIHQDGPVYIYTDMISKMPKAGWYVLFNREVSSTRGFNTSVIKLDGKTQLGSNVRFVEFKNKRDAVDFESKINSVDFIAACREAAGSIRKTITRATLQSISIT